MKNKHKKQSGVTLIELLVVISVLAALAAITIPTLTDARSAAHIGNSVANLQNINSTLTNTHALSSNYANNLDSLVHDNAGTDELTDLLADIGPGGDLTLVGLTAEQADSLTSAGISAVQQLDTRTNIDGNADQDPTFNPYPAGDPTYTIATGQGMVQISSTVVNEQLGAPATDDYFVFGFGLKNTIIGDTMLECPVHYPHEGNPSEDYNRFLVVFKVDDTVGETEPATYVGALANDEGELVGVNSHLFEYYGG